MACGSILEVHGPLPQHGTGRPGEAIGHPPETHLWAGASFVVAGPRCCREIARGWIFPEHDVCCLVPIRSDHVKHPGGVSRTALDPPARRPCVQRQGRSRLPYRRPHHPHRRLYSSHRQVRLPSPPSTLYGVVRHVPAGIDFAVRLLISNTTIIPLLFLP
jgi:hypothetical protein